MLRSPMVGRSATDWFRNGVLLKPRLPRIDLYPGDWLRDGVSGCSLAAQGLWLRMMFVMHDSDEYGYLTLNGSPMEPGNITRRCGCSPADYEPLLVELFAAGVPSRRRDGTIFSRRMVRDEKRRKDGAKFGALGGNPKLKPRSHKEKEHKGGLSPPVNTQGYPPPDSDVDSDSDKDRPGGVGEPPGLNRLMAETGVGIHANPILRGKCAELIRVAGYERAKSAIDKGIREKRFAAPRAVGYALGIITNQEIDGTRAAPTSEGFVRRKPTAEDVE